jgi:hypothetical protein
MIKHPTDVKVKDVKQYRLNGFRGVDFTSSPLNVAEQRSPDAKNWVYEHGRPTKRYGWKQMAYVAGNSVNGIYEYDDDKLLVFAGTKVYTVALSDTGVGYTTTAVTITGLTIKNHRVQFFKQDERIFIVGSGDFLVWHKPAATWVLERVFDNAITYIPTTTISIDYEGYGGESLKAALERPNLMTQWRINTARGVDEVPTARTYILDGVVDTSIDAATDVIAYVTIDYDDGGVGDTQELLGYYDSAEDRIDLRESYEAVTSYGYITEDGTMVLETDTSPMTASDNITVKFRGSNNDEYGSAGVSNHLRTSAFGTLFGVDGVTTQLFMAGHVKAIGFSSTMKNVDFYSYPLDFTYWPDNFTRTVGNSAITGYHRIGDGSLVIFKEKSYAEAAIFLRTGTLETEADEDYFNAEIVYSEKAGYASDYLVSRHTIDTIGGDPVYLTADGLRGIVLSENVATDERFARRRSFFVDEKLKTYSTAPGYTEVGSYDDGGAIGFTYKGKYYLAVDDVCFVADSAMTVGENSSFEYEWQFWDNIPARVFTEIQDELWFGTDDGRLCKFDVRYTDDTFTEIESTDLSFHPANDEFVYSSELEIAEGDIIKFNEPKLYELVMDSTMCENVLNVITASTDAAKARVLLMNELEAMILIDTTDDSYMACYAQNVDYGAYSFELVDAEGVAIDMSGYTDYTLAEALNGVEVYIKDLVEAESFQIARTAETEAISLFSYDLTTVDDVTEVGIEAIIITKANVVAEWFSPITSFGSSFLEKTLISLTVVADGYMTFGYLTRIGELAREYEKISGFSFTDFDFTRFTFTAFSEAITKKVKERGINFAMFSILSDSASVCSLNEIIVRFRYNNMIRGVL